MNNSNIILSINNDIFNVTFQNIKFTKKDYIEILTQLENVIQIYNNNNKKFYFLINTTKTNMLEITNVMNYIIKFALFFKNNKVLISKTIKYAYILCKKKSILLTIIEKLYSTIIPYKIIVIKHVVDNNYINKIINKHIICSDDKNILNNELNKLNEVNELNKLDELNEVNENIITDDINKLVSN